LFLSLFFYSHASHWHLPSFPTRRSSDLAGDRRRLLRIVGEEQPQPVVRVSDPPRRIQARRQNEPDVPRLDRLPREARRFDERPQDRKSTRLNSSHVAISYAVFCLKKKKN